MKKMLRFVPLILLIAIVLFLVGQLKRDDAIAPTEDWRGKPFPAFQAKHLLDTHAKLSNESLPKEPFILNVWASWCTWCIKEFPMLLSMQAKGIPIVGLTYADKPQQARNALKQWGNPFVFVIDEYTQPHLSQVLNIHSAPISYVVDKKGKVRYQQHGYHADFEQMMIPLIEQLREEP